MAAVMSGALKPIMGLFGDLAYSKNITLVYILTLFIENKLFRL